jgi:hypothetical protein
MVAHTVREQDDIEVVRIISARQAMLSAIENSKEMAIRQFVFLELACLREKARFDHGRCVPTFVAVYSHMV